MFRLLWMQFVKMKLGRLPVLFRDTPLSEIDVYINNDYQLTDNFKVYTKSASETLKEINKLRNSEEGLYGVINYNNEYTQPFEKVCLLNDEQLRQKGII